MRVPSRTLGISCTTEPLAWEGEILISSARIPASKRGIHERGHSCMANVLGVGVRARLGYLLCSLLFMDSVQINQRGALGDELLK